MKKDELLSLVDAKASEMAAALETLTQRYEETMDALSKGLPVKNGLSENTYRTQKFQRQTAIHNMLVLKAIAEQAGDEITLTGDIEKWFSSMVTLTSTRKATKITVNKGDKLMDLLQKYKDLKDVYAKIMKAASEAGLSLNLDHFE